jgi:hypothetical protein
MPLQRNCRALTPAAESVSQNEHFQKRSRMLARPTTLLIRGTLNIQLHSNPEILRCLFRKTTT